MEPPFLSFVPVSYGQPAFAFIIYITLTNVSPHSNHASSNTNHSTFTPRAPTARPVLVARVKGSPDDIIDSLTDHQCLRHTRLGVEDSASFPQERDEDGLACVVFAEPGDIAHGRFEALLGDTSAEYVCRDAADSISATYFDTQLVLERDGQPMQRTDGLLVSLKVCVELFCLGDGGFGEEFKATVDLH